MEGNIIKSNIGKLIIGFCFLALVVWQLFLEYVAYKFSSLFDDIQIEENLTVFIADSQPFMWLFTAVTVVIAIDIFKRGKLLVLNSVSVLIALAIGTFFLQLLVILAGYAPIFELGAEAPK
jgi:putative effector of murein hydrolase